MQLKGKTSAFILWILMTLASVLISAWVHKLATQTPADKEARLVKRNFDVILADLQNHLQWLWMTGCCACLTSWIISWG